MPTQRVTLLCGGPEVCPELRGTGCQADFVRRRQVIAEHYCTHVHGSNMHQCIIFDSDRPDARLIGIECEWLYRM